MEPIPHDSRSRLFSEPSPGREASLTRQQSPGQSLEGAHEPAPSRATPQPEPDPRWVALLLARLAVRRYLKEKEETREKEKTHD